MSEKAKTLPLINTDDTDLSGLAILAFCPWPALRRNPLAAPVA
jgi:hypothetical protein